MELLNITRYTSKLKIITLGFIAFSLACSNLFGQISIASKYIEVVMDNTSGRFYIATLVGEPDNPRDDKKKILFEKIPPTTYPSLFVDGEGFVVGTDDGFFEGRPGISKNRLVWVWRPKKFDKVKLLQIIEIVTNPFTLREDMARISYMVVNENNKEHRVAVRLILDTVLGEGDSAPFFVPPFGKVENEIVFYEGNMPEVWYSFDSLSTPKVRTMGIVSGIEGVSTPSKLIFANWRKLGREKWEYTPEVGASFGGGLFGGRDSAVAIYFEETKLKPQELVLYSTMYGLYGDTLKKFENLTISVTTPEVITTFPFSVSAVVENNSGVSIKDLTIELEVNTNYFYLTNSPIFQASTLGSGNSVLSSWSVFNQPGLKDGEYEVKVKVSGTAISTNITEEVFRKLKVALKTHQQKVIPEEFGIKQTNIATNLSGTNLVFITNFYTNYITNVTYITNIRDYEPLDEVKRIESIISRLNRELDILITTYYLTKDNEERNRLKKKLELIKAQIEVEKEKLRALTER